MRIRLASYVNAPQAYDFGCYARLNLEEAAARRLLSWLEAYNVAAQSCNAWALRVEDSRVAFYRTGPEEDWSYGLDGDWWRMADDLEEFAERDRVEDEIQTAEVDGTGVHWHTYVNDDIPIETLTISWRDLEEVAAGRDPFYGGPRCDACNSAHGPLECIAGEVYYCVDIPRCAQVAAELAAERGVVKPSAQP
jgi:hypothetical protein